VLFGAHTGKPKADLLQQPAADHLLLQLQQPAGVHSSALSRIKADAMTTHR
jgi:hypothetical protein